MRTKWLVLLIFIKGHTNSHCMALFPWRFQGIPHTGLQVHTIKEPLPTVALVYHPVLVTGSSLASGSHSLHNPTCTFQMPFNPTHSALLSLPYPSFLPSVITLYLFHQHFYSDLYTVPNLTLPLYHSFYHSSYRLVICIILPISLFYFDICMFSSCRVKLFYISDRLFHQKQIKGA